MISRSTVSNRFWFQVENFFAKYPDAGAGAAPREQALDSIRTNIAWVERNQQAIFDWLKTR